MSQNTARHRAYVGIGSNLGDAAAHVRDAIAALAPVGTVSAISSLYRTKPWGVADQSDFVNAVVRLETELAPRALLTALKALERQLGRVPSKRWGPRLIDLDILTYDDLEIAEPDLRIPHPHMRERAFVLVPLAEIDPDFAPALAGISAEERAGVAR